MLISAVGARDSCRSAAASRQSRPEIKVATSLSNSSRCILASHQRYMDEDGRRQQQQQQQQAQVPNAHHVFHADNVNSPSR